VRDTLEAAHVELGCDAIRGWSLPDFVAAICRGHHGLEVLEDAPAELHLVRLASGLGEISANPGYLPALEGEVLASMEALGISPAQVRQTHQELRFYASEVPTL